jgi:hypothetical protein
VPDVYRLHGWHVRSPEITLPAPVVAAETVDLDVTHLAEPGNPRNLQDPADALLYMVHGGEPVWGMWPRRDGWELIAPRVGRFLIDRHRQRVVCESFVGKDRALLPLLTAGGALSVLLTLRGRWVMHASAVAVDGRAIAIGGGSGRGKSTLATLMVASGAEYLADDLLCVRADDCAVHPGADTVRLRVDRDTAESLSGGAPVSPSADGRMEIRFPVPADPRPLAAVVLPMLAPAVTTVELTPLAGSDAVRAVHTASRLWGWRDEDVLRHEFDRVASIAASVPVFVAAIPIRRPLDAGLGGEVLDAVKRAAIT